MSAAAVPAASDAQKPSEVAAPEAVGRGTRNVARSELTEPPRASTVVDLVPVQIGVITDTVTLVALLSEALTVLTIYAEVAVPVTSYRGAPMSAHAPRELVERIHRAIG